MDFKKMILIDPRTMDSIQKQQQPPLPDATTENLKELDNDMKNLLEKDDLSFVDKANHYQQVLYHYLQRAKEYKNKPLGSVIIKQSPAPPDQPTEDGSTDVKAEEEGEDIAEYVPKAYKSKAQRLLKRLRTHPNLSWNQRGEITWDEQVVPQTNLVDLVNDVLRKRKLFSPATGWETFAAALRDVNVPREFVGNPDRWRYITQTPTAKHSDWTHLHRRVRPRHQQQQQQQQQQLSKLTELEEKQRERRERLLESIKKKHKKQMKRSQEQTGARRKLTWENW